ncbi:guanosine-3',5'-bis(diphosphate) 3'-pyrophosphohydrolase [Neisseria elongata subsp. glycolytica]|uniref:RelA/SpoT family protein n=1 Tax=Neisseria elongata subsp. glycolytica ATCC 29315 TaxID=546263 RepID=D4DSV2_NEIEG|nr:RelA/SpoT family protein [Neisseria elongata subsp. glycolytica ATCC 29315]SQH50899.1 guanosine-3',5'-bis(diphosphate) 3'-pyrophosphohydrolase [Neisseria elongata subsp. glycolytica]
MSAPQATAPYDPLTAEARSLLFKTASYLSQEDKQRLEKACAYAFRAHDGQTRKSGEPYITHPIAVATELAKWRMDLQTLSAGLMHDVLEDTGTTKEEMAAEFGETVADMVDGLSKLEKLKYDNQTEHQAESFRKLILAMTKDMRVIIVKLSDRLHNMRTLGSMRLEKRRRISQETLEIYAPIANRIGLNPVYRELQDLAFQNIHPARYRTLQKAMNNFRRNRRDVVGKVLAAFSQRLVGANIEAQIKGREKNLYSIHQKMRNKHLRFDEVMDIYGFRVITNSIPACYAALGALHNLYQPKPGKFKDYIAIPKSNGYQSLHTTLTGPHGLPIEVQIRTREMNAVAESGVASHWAYKSGDDKLDQATLNTNKWLQNILDLQARSANAIEFLEHVKVDLFPSEVYIFTPQRQDIGIARRCDPH